MHAKSHAHIEENRRADRHSTPGRQQNWSPLKSKHVYFVFFSRRSVKTLSASWFKGTPKAFPGKKA